MPLSAFVVMVRFATARMTRFAASDPGAHVTTKLAACSLALQPRNKETGATCRRKVSRIWQWSTKRADV